MAEETCGTALPTVLPESVLTDAEAFDVVVIGFGMAGACATHLGGGTAVQRATGHDDSPDAMFDYLMAVTPSPDALKIRSYADDSAAHLDWLEALGFSFERSFYVEKAVIQPGTEG